MAAAKPKLPDETAQAEEQPVKAAIPVETQQSASFKQLLDAAGLRTDYSDGDGEVAFDEVARGLKELKDLKGQQTRAPEKYDFSLPQDFKAPEGAGPWKPDPSFTEAVSNIARENNLPQAVVSQFVKAYAEHQSGKIEAGNKARKEALARRGEAQAKVLGPNAQERISGVGSALEAGYGKNHGIDAVTPEGIKNLEDLISRAGGAQRMSSARPNGEAKLNLSALVGQKGGARKLIEIANTTRRQ